VTVPLGCGLMDRRYHTTERRMNETFDWMMYIALMLAVVISFVLATWALFQNNAQLIAMILVYLMTHIGTYWLYRHHRTR
jgi:uncharacterized membrane protein